MNHPFQIVPVNAAEIHHLFSMDEQELTQIGARRITVDQKPGYPCRVSLEDAAIGEEVILLPFQHHKVASPYQASGPIFVRTIARTAQLEVNEIPVMLHHRLLSLRAYSADAMMINGVTIEGKILREQIEQILGDSAVAYIQVHNAGPGCYNCQVNRM